MRMIGSDTRLCLVIGYPMAKSLSPLMHNAAYEALGIEDRYVFAAARVQPARLSAALDGMKAMGVRGVSCTMPHKESVIPLLNEVDVIARRIGAVNTIVVGEDQRLIGYNTDWLGVINPLKERTSLDGKSAVILGAGGAARAAAFGLGESGARVKILARSLHSAQLLATAVGAEHGGLDRLDEVRDFDIVFNATPVGMAPNLHESLLEAHQLRRGQIVFDSVYVPHRTRLTEMARAAGAEAMHGIEMLLHQGAAQFEHYTGHKAPLQAMREALMSNLEIGV